MSMCKQELSVMVKSGLIVKLIIVVKVSVFQPSSFNYLELVCESNRSI